MSVTVWTLPSSAIPVSVPVVYQHGVSTEVVGDCLTVFAGPDHPLAVWGSGAWQRADIS